MHQDVESPMRLVFDEEWANQAALSARFTVPASRAFGRALAALADGTPQMAVFEATRVR